MEGVTVNPSKSLGCRDGGAVPRYDLRLIRKDLPTTRIDEHLQPVHVIVAVLSVVAESLDACKVLDATTAGILEWLVDPEVVRVAMHVGNRLAEGNHFVAQCAEEVVIAVRLPVGLHQRRRGAYGGPRPVAQVPAGVGL